MKLTPYRVVAKNALMKKGWGYELSEEEAEKTVETETFEELESKVYAQETMKNAIEAITRFSRLPDWVIPRIEAMCFEGEGEGDDFVLRVLGGVAREEKMSIIDVLSKVHDGWVRNKDNAKKFNKEGREAKKYQHLPIEMIGWEEAKADLLFVAPILEAMNYKVNEQELEREYNERVVKFFNAKGLVDEKGIVRGALARLIAKGHEFYEPLTEENSAKGRAEAELMAGQVAEKLSNINLKTKSC